MIDLYTSKGIFYISMGKVELVLEKSKDILREDTRGMTIQEISDKLHVSRITAAIALAKLEGAGLIDVRVIGNCKLHYWRLRKK